MAIGDKKGSYDVTPDTGVSRVDPRYRDVYSNQQIERTPIGPPRKKTIRTIVSIIVGVLVFCAGLLAMSVFDFVLALYQQFVAKQGTAQFDLFAMTSIWKYLVPLLLGGGIGFIVWWKLMLNLSAQNTVHDTSELNSYDNDQMLCTPAMVMERYNFFPDAGARADIEANAVMSHAVFSAKGIKNVDVVQRYPHDVYDENGELEAFEGEPIIAEDGTVVTKSLPLIDTEFGHGLFEASKVPEGSLRVFYDTTKIPYNPNNDGENKTKSKDKNKPYKTVADFINAEWELLPYEPQRPAGAYLVDSSPTNTMVIAITRGGKGQGVIEPTIDIWSREVRQHNIFVNDPKGELLVKFFARLMQRGYDVVQFNLINPAKTDIYNPLGMAADGAREKDVARCAQYIENIADVFFPLDGGDDPVWPAAANNAFKRAAYGLIDHLLEKEWELRRLAARTGMPQSTLLAKLDELWGQASLYNCYQLFVRLSAKTIKNPQADLAERFKAGEFTGREEVYLEETKKAEAIEFLWDGQPKLDMLSLYFNATEALPRNPMRTLISNVNNSLKAMGTAEKMLASVYGIAITAMEFFTRPTIATLTSGRPSQNVDLGGLSFPRRISVRFDPEFLEYNQFVGLQARWSAYADDNFSENLGKKFTHEDIIGKDGWANYVFEGIFPEEVAYVKLEVVNPTTGMLVRSFYFRFQKSFATTLNGRHFITNPITDEKIYKNGIVDEYIPERDSSGAIVRYVLGSAQFKKDRIVDIESGNPRKVVADYNAIVSIMARYSEKPKAVFVVTPPHLMSYAKLILVLLKQLVDLNFDKSYMTKANQKPLYKTRFMLDELGNLQSEGHGISGFQTMLSIGLGQGQEFTLILQTLQQLRDVYGVKSQDESLPICNGWVSSHQSNTRKNLKSYTATTELETVNVMERKQKEMCR